jgi:hypothetical protein
LLEIRAEPLALGQAWAFQSLSLSHQTPRQLSGLFHAGKEEKQARGKYIISPTVSRVIVENDSITILFARTPPKQTAANTTFRTLLQHDVYTQLPTTKQASVESTVGRCQSTETPMQLRNGCSYCPVLERRSAAMDGGANTYTCDAPPFFATRLLVKCHHSYYFAWTKVTNDET